jgi:aspartate racemase
MIAAREALEGAGADFFLIAANTLHKVAGSVVADSKIPFVSIIDATARRARFLGLNRVGLLATRFTMEDDFFREAMQRFEIEVLVPERKEDRDEIHRVIFEEIAFGRMVQESRDRYRRVIDTLIARGAEGVILGCTEIPLLLNSGDAPVPLLDTATLHVDAAVEYLFSPC